MPRRDLARLPVTLEFGRSGSVRLDLGEKLRAFADGPRAVFDVAETAREALSRPDGMPPLEHSVIADDQVAVVLEPDVAGGPELLAEVVARLATAGVGPEHATLVQPLLAATADPRGGLPGEWAGMPRVLHDPQDDDACRYLATTTAGERVYLANPVVDADAVVIIGQLGFDPLLGFRGGQSGLYPALSNAGAARKAIGQGHAELSPEDRRPLRDTVDEIGWLLGSPYVVQVVPSRGGGVAEVLAGSPEAVHRAGSARLAELWTTAIDERAGAVVIGVPDAGPGDGWDRVAAAAEVGRRLVKPDGRIVLLGEVPEPPGPGLRIVASVEEPADAIAPLREAVPPDLTAATRLAAAARWARLYLHGHPHGDTVEDLFMVPIDDPAAVARLLADEEDCVVIGSGQFAFGRVRETAGEAH